MIATDDDCTYLLINNFFIIISIYQLKVENSRKNVGKT
jgi:hypothetical protein